MTLPFDPAADVNPGRFLAALVIEELRRHGLGLVVACPGGRNQPVLGAVAARDDLERVRAVDERAAGHLALGWLRGRLAAGDPPALAAVVTTSGSAPLLLAPALAEAHATGLPLVLISADRPAELHDVGANQTLDQVAPLAPFTRARFTLPCHAGGAGPHDVLGAVGEAARIALRPSAGPVQLNLAFREPLAPDPLPLPSGWTARAAEWAAADRPYVVAPATFAVPAAAVDQLREEIGSARRPLVWAANLAGAEDRAAARAIATSSGAPWLADAGSGLRLDPPEGLRLDHAGFYPDLVAEADLVLQFGHLPVSLRQTIALTGARRWLVCDHPGRQDPRRQGGVVLQAAPRTLLDALGDSPLRADPDPSWTARLDEAQRTWRARLAERVEAGSMLTEAWLARELTRWLGPAHALVLGNSLAVRHADMFIDASDAGPLSVTSRGTSGIEGLVAQSAGVAASIGRPTVALLGDVTVQHDLGSFALVADEQPPLLLLVVQNGGGAIFRQLPGGRHPDLLDPWLTAHHNVEVTAVARAHGLTATRARSRDDVAEALDGFLRRPTPTVLEAVVAPEGHATMLAALAEDRR